MPKEELRRIARKGGKASHGGGQGRNSRSRSRSGSR
jgi:hypothetical protein